MNHPLHASGFLHQEVRGLLARLDKVRPFSLTMPTVTGAAVPKPAWMAIESHLARERQKLRQRLRSFMRWLAGPNGRRVSPQNQQRHLTLLRLQFNATLDQLDIFADVLTQRAEHETGVWLAGLDTVAAEALLLSGHYFEPPPLVTYLDRGHGAAIRRARTRLPGGPKNPVGIVRVPRERMIGSCGIGSSLAHEVGHQGSALLDLVRSLREVLRGRMQKAGPQKPIWKILDRWISEICADYWALSKMGVAATLGLIGVVSLPRAFVFRINLDDPHPFPWIRVKLSCAIGRALYPDPQWSRLSRLWNSLYPTSGLTLVKQRFIQLLEAALPAFVKLLINHRPKALRGKSLREVMPVAQRQPTRLRALLRAWLHRPQDVGLPLPTLAFAVIGQGRADHAIDPEHESQLLARFLESWALHGVLGPETSRRLLSRSA